MKVNKEEHRERCRYYILDTVGKPCIMIVLPEHDTIFHYTLGEMILAMGESREEAIENWKKRKEGEKYQRNWGWADECTERVNKVERGIDNMWDWIRGKGWG